jgi:ubiquinol-cytochrome c reductase cytochrome b subunit
LLGVVAMFGSLFILLILPLTDLSRTRSNQFRPAMKLAFWFFVVNFIILTWIGSQHPESPFIEIGQSATAFYFAWFLILVPLFGILENTLFDVATATARVKQKLLGI